MDSTNARLAGTHDFDFDNIWAMVSGSRPMLRWEYSTTITNAHQLQLMALDLNAHYTLAHDLDLTGEFSAINGYSGIWGSGGFVPVGNGEYNETLNNFQYRPTG